VVAHAIAGLLLQRDKLPVLRLACAGMGQQG
jgi:hypothetical protein